MWTNCTGTPEGLNGRSGQREEQSKRSGNVIVVPAAAAVVAALDRTRNIIATRWRRRGRVGAAMVVW